MAEQILVAVASALRVALCEGSRERCERHGRIDGEEDAVL